jgi:hypothetical protein
MSDDDTIEIKRKGAWMNWRGLGGLVVLILSGASVWFRTEAALAETRRDIRVYSEECKTRQTELLQRLDKMSDDVKRDHDLLIQLKAELDDHARRLDRLEASRPYSKE